MPQQLVQTVLSPVYVYVDVIKHFFHCCKNSLQLQIKVLILNLWISDFLLGAVVLKFNQNLVIYKFMNF